MVVLRTKGGTSERSEGYVWVGGSRVLCLQKSLPKTQKNKGKLRSFLGFCRAARRKVDSRNTYERD